MKRDLRTISELSEQTGFLLLTVEKVIRLAEILTEIHSHPFLSNRLVLKGGTAIQLFYLKAKRLSVDLDFNYIGALEKNKMLEERPQVEEALKRSCASLGYTMRRIPTEEHAGGKWRLVYQSATNQSQVLELDINYLYRIPIWGTHKKKIYLPGGEINCTFPIVDERELWAGKIAAALSRAEPRDFYDLTCMPTSLRKSADLRRTAILFASGGRNDLRKVNFKIIDQLSPKEIQDRLFPVIRADEALDPNQIKDIGLKIIKPILNFNQQEGEYLDLFLDRGNYQPELLFPEEELSKIVESHPVLLWKEKNLRQFLKKSGVI